MRRRQQKALVCLMREVRGGQAALDLAKVFARATGTGGTMKPKPKKTAPVAGKAAALVRGGARVKDAGDRLSRKRYELKGRDGRPVRLGSKTIERPSEYDQALIGCFYKLSLQRQGAKCRLSDFERSLLTEAAEKDAWCGETPDGAYYDGSQGAAAPAAVVKGLLDDTVSGGLYLSPVVFDDSVILYPILNGELFPYVDLKQVTGRRVYVPTMQNLTVGWGTMPGTAVTPFTTAGLVDAISSTLANVQGFMEISRDLLLDSPVNIGATVTDLFGQRLKAELDHVIAAGSGVGQPLGIANTALTIVPSDHGTGGPPTVSDYEALMFAVPKAYRQRDWSPAFIGSDMSYRRSRSIQVGSDDQRRVFGMDEASYQLLDTPYRISVDLPNSTVIYGMLKRYRMYQRAGMEIVSETGGFTLTLRNTYLVGIRARFGGQPIDPAAFSMMTTAQT